MQNSKDNYTKVMIIIHRKSLDLRMFLCNINHKEMSKERGNAWICHTL